MSVPAADAAPCAGAGAASPDDRPCGYFDFEKMKSDGLLKQASEWLFRYPQREWVAALLRNFFPVFRIPLTNWYFVSRYDDVRDVLLRDRDFPVPWGGKMQELTGKENFVLGMPDGPEYRRNYVQLAKAFPREEVYARVTGRSRELSEEILDNCHNRIDAIQDLIAYVPALLCEEYFGIDVPDKVRFSELTIGMSQYMFGPPNGSDKPLAMAAANCFRPLVKASIEKARHGEKPDTVVQRLVDLQASDNTLTEEVIEAHLFGMITGFIPTNVIAGGDILDTLFRFPAFMERAREAAFAGDDDLLWGCLQETLRFHFINPGQWRHCPDGATIAAGTEREAAIPPGSYLMVSMQSAMFDPRNVHRAHEFDPRRRSEDYIVFGHGRHWCIGAYIAIGQLTQTFRALLRRKGLRRADSGGALQRYSIYPAHLCVEFDS